MRRRWALVAVVVSLAGPAVSQQAPVRLSQGQVAGQFLRAVLRADYPAAYGKLAPEVRQSIKPKRFEAAAQPLRKSGKGRKPEIELYKLGVRLGDGGRSRLFYTFAFAADSALKPPPVLLEVTFRDTASRVILSFRVQTSKGSPKLLLPQGSRH